MALYARQPCSSISPSSIEIRRVLMAISPIYERDKRKYGHLVLIGPVHLFLPHQKCEVVIRFIYSIFAVDCVVLKTFICFEWTLSYMNAYGYKHYYL